MSAAGFIISNIRYFVEKCAKNETPANHNDLGMFACVESEGILRALIISEAAESRGWTVVNGAAMMPCRCAEIAFPTACPACKHTRLVPALTDKEEPR